MCKKNIKKDQTVVLKFVILMKLVVSFLTALTVNIVVLCVQ